jgi:predicted Rossmann fold nucleotide-binding protein DprA/Smf involved in DNA uptake
VQGVEDVLVGAGADVRRSGAGRPGGGPRGPPGPEADEKEVLSLLEDPEPIHLDALAEAAPFGVARLQAALFGLEARGLVDPLPGRYYVAAPRKET